MTSPTVERPVRSNAGPTSSKAGLWRVRKAAFLVASGVAAEAVLIRLGQTYGSTPEERELRLLGDQIVPNPQVVTNHAITINAPAERVWSWLVQMGWHRAGWYTARWVDKLLFPLNWPSANRIIPELQDIHIGDFIPDGAPETEVDLSSKNWNPVAQWHYIPQAICR